MIWAVLAIGGAVVVVGGLTWLGLRYRWIFVPHEVMEVLDYSYRTARRIVVAVVGLSVIVVGLAMMVLPGPGIGTVVAGLAILAAEFAFARRWLRKAKEAALSVADWATNNHRGEQPLDGDEGMADETKDDSKG